MDEVQWIENQERKRSSTYTHFDYRVTLAKCYKYISNKDNVEKHGFYPFIHYKSKSRRIKNGRKTDSKIRDIYYAAHLDSWIYRYYAYKLNELYNKRLIKDDMVNVPVAYRTDLKKNNIQFAAEAFRFIRSLRSCYILIGDFTNFFDTLDHSYLKDQLLDLLQKDSLDSDFYAVYKNITKFSFFELDDLLKLNKLDNSKKGISKFNKLNKALTTEQLHNNRKLIKPNPGRNVGVPQGSPISAVLANIYMLSVDKLINDYVAQHDGFYMRYSDDFIVIIPGDNKAQFHQDFEWIKDKIENIAHVQLQDKKTKIFYFEDNEIVSCTSDFLPDQNNSKNKIDFLGFTFDGKSVTIRDKTLSKYYQRLYRKAKTIVRNKGISSRGNRISCQNLYQRYSYKGSLSYCKKKKDTIKDKDKKLKGNFLDYVGRAQREFLNDPITLGTKRHMQKIRKALKSKN